MNLFEQLELQEKMEAIKNKWPTPPVKNSLLWWRYRGDQSLYRMLKDKLKLIKRAQEKVDK